VADASNNDDDDEGRAPTTLFGEEIVGGDYKIDIRRPVIPLSCGVHGDDILLF